MSKFFALRQLSLGLLVTGFATMVQAEEAATASAPMALKPISNMEFTRSQLSEVLLPAHSKLAQASADLAAVSRKFCAAPDASSFASLQAQYVNTLAAWRTIEIAPLGPTSEPEVGRIMEGAAQSPEQILTLAKQRPAGEMVDGQAAYEARVLPAWGIGFKAIESLLYTDKPTKSMQRLSQADACAYLSWQAQVVAYHTETLRRAWQGLSRGVAYDLSYPRTYQTQYFNRLVEGAREIGAAKVGLTQSGWQDQRAAATVIGLRANVAGIRGLLTGNQAGIGLDDFMLSREDKDKWAQVDVALKALEAALPTSEQALKPAAAKKLAAAGNQLADVLEKQIAPLMSIKIGKVQPQ